MTVFNVNEDDNISRMRRGELYYAFTPSLVAARKRCKRAVAKINAAEDPTRREMAELWKEVTNDERPLPPPAATEDEEDVVLHEYPWVEAPIKIDYGTNVKVGSNVFINYGCTILDTCTVTIGSRTLIGPHVSFFSGTHPLDPQVRNGTNGPELGGPITVGEDCWIAGNVTILPGITIGDGSTVGAGSVVTKDVPPYHVVAGNPARILRKLERKPNGEQEVQGNVAENGKA
ncbi:acetyltransferase [Fusarium flagelliforme]|uniref:Acetyltransferase n=1 Tax=Fusarium flagelliforme TaxID=2675880 RepID=A0A395MXV7_9HYPO|nr:acetyltransferase [Fusarium flagelliforme]